MLLLDWVSSRGKRHSVEANCRYLHVANLLPSPYELIYLLTMTINSAPNLDKMTQGNTVPIRVTVDTNVLDKNKLAMIHAAVGGKKVELADTTVTGRELEGTDITRPADTVVETGVWGESCWGEFVWGQSVQELFILGESHLNQAVLGSDSSSNRFEAILQVISSGTFPKQQKRSSLTRGQRRQMRDAMILEAHSREGRDIFVTDNVRDFILGKDGSNKRQTLEQICSTHIMTTDEFCTFCKTLP